MPIEPFIKGYSQKALQTIYKFALQKMEDYGPNPNPWLASRLVRKSETRYGKRSNSRKHEYYRMLMVMSCHGQSRGDTTQEFDTAKAKFIEVIDAVHIDEIKNGYVKAFVKKLLNNRGPGRPPSARTSQLRTEVISLWNSGKRNPELRSRLDEFCNTQPNFDPVDDRELSRLVSYAKKYSK